MSTHLILSNNLSNNVSCSRYFFYLSPLHLHSSSFFTRQHSPSSSPNSLLWLSSTFNTPHFSIFTTKDCINTSSTSPTPNLFRRPRFKVFVQRNLNDTTTSSTSIIHPLHTAPEPPYLPCIDTFNGWFGILFKDDNYLTHVRSPRSSAILIFYGLSDLIPLYRFTLSIPYMRTLSSYCS